MFGTASTSQRLEAYESLARGLRSGLPMTSALRLVTDSGRVTEVLLASATLIEQGDSLVGALQRTGRGEIPEEELRLLEAGEQAGRLPELLTRLAQQLEERVGRRRRLLAGMIYPWILVNASILAVGAPRVVSGLGPFLGYVLPKLALVWILTFGLSVAISRLARSESGRRSLRDAATRLPSVGRAARLRAAAEYAHAMSISLDAGLTIPQSLELGGRAAGWSPLTEATQRIADAVRSGASLADAHAREGVIPREIVASVRVGEPAGSLDLSFAGAARSLDEQATRSAKRATVVLPAVIYLLVAILVAWIVITGYASLASLPLSLDI